MCTYVVNVISAEAGPVSDSGLERISISGWHGVCGRVWTWQWLYWCRQVLRSWL